MEKISLNPEAILFPAPATLVTCHDGQGGTNIITISYIGILNSKPPLIGMGVRPIRYSYAMLINTREFVINIPGEQLHHVTDYCGVVSGKKVDKFKVTGLTPINGDKVKAPLIGECPVNLECKVNDIISYDSHDFFVGEVVAVHVDSGVVTEDGSWGLDKFRPFAFCPGPQEYWSLGDFTGKIGFSKGKLPK
jgi:flavin reductase (DIM6/NTAB) family NADH-FMN oxidoreductase RutF